jgi:hypothetical protein
MKFLLFPFRIVKTGPWDHLLYISLYISSKDHRICFIVYFLLTTTSKNCKSNFCIKEHVGVHLCSSCSHNPHDLHPTTTKALVPPHRTIKAIERTKRDRPINPTKNSKHQAKKTTRSLSFILGIHFQTHRIRLAFSFSAPSTRNLAHMGWTRPVVIISNYVFILIKKSLGVFLLEILPRTLVLQLQMKIQANLAVYVHSKTCPWQRFVSVMTVGKW